ncbi:hypothetical protein [Dyadobacter sp. CY343]|uniref:hypothetical protein n=1 Tax=Dyadobacter sp. CY343 TaxID=2907299 RepID=UPI001F3D9073|nr:hypothetical protein [Dyadobacter sp. CY343]MCE7059825.1 hypothetical protein [Dyadobacter sp. CY343]
MKLFEQYAKIRQKAYVTFMITESVSGSMALENQQVPDTKVRAIVISLIEEAEARGRTFDD